MKWILIFWLWINTNSGGPATAEFNDKKSCENAIEKIKKESGIWVDFKGFCVPKGK